MRSSLFTFSSDCPQKKECSYCNILGYRNNQSWPDSKTDIEFEKIKNSFQKQIVLPCSSALHEKYNKITSDLSTKNIKIKNLLWNQLWDQLPTDKKNRIDKKNTALFFTEFDQYIASNEKFEFEGVYFLVTKKSWSFDQWSKLEENSRKKLKLYFPANMVDSKDYFTATEAYQLGEQVLKFDAETIFEVPFSYDLLDGRNKKHQLWNFSEQPAWSSKKNDLVKLSIIIPTYNRKDYIVQVMSALAGQTLPKDKFEIIIIDDGGNDLTEQGLLNFIQLNADLNISYIYIRRDISLNGLYVGNRVGPIRNAGVRQAVGDIILFLDSDIILPENYLTDILDVHLSYDIIVPKRIYLKKNIFEKDLKLNQTEEAPWGWYLNEFYQTGSWFSEGTPWKYFMTYALSMRKNFFIKTNGFRSNFISYGYEDLDMGYRIMKNQNPKLYFFNQDVFHLNHFKDKNAEYSASQGFRKFQLSMTARMFIFQNMPFNSTYLIHMAYPKGLLQKLYFCIFKLLWKINSLIQLIMAKK